MSLLRSVSVHLEDLFPDENQCRDPRPIEPGVRFEARSAGRRGVELRLLGLGDDRSGQEVLAGLAVRLLALHLTERFEVDPESCGRSWLLVTRPAEQIHLRTLVPARVMRFFPTPLPVTRHVEGRRVTLSALGLRACGPYDLSALMSLRRKLALALLVDPRRPGAAELAALHKTQVPPLDLHLDLERLTTSFLAP